MRLDQFLDVQVTFFFLKGNHKIKVIQFNPCIFQMRQLRPTEIMQQPKVIDLDLCLNNTYNNYSV